MPVLAATATLGVGSAVSRAAPILQAVATLGPEQFGPEALRALWLEQQDQYAESPLTDRAADKLRRETPQMSPAVARALVLACMWAILFAGLFTVALQNPGRAKEFMALSGLTPFGVATNAVTVAAACWAVSSKKKR